MVLSEWAIQGLQQPYKVSSPISFSATKYRWVENEQETGYESFVRQYIPQILYYDLYRSESFFGIQPFRERS